MKTISVLIYLITIELLSINRAVTNTLLTFLPNKIKVTKISCLDIFSSG